MAITLGGIMRGALPVLQQAVEAPMQDAVARMDSIGKLYNAKAGEFQKKQAEVLSDKDKIETIAKSFGVDIGIAEQAYKISGKSVDKASKIVTNMLSAYDNQIPITKVDVDKLATEPVPEVTKIENVDIAPKNASNNSIFNSFKNLFKYYSPDQVVEMFAERSNIPIDQVRKVLSGTFDMPELNVTQRATPEALRAGMTKPSAPSQSQIDVGNIKQFYLDTMNYNEEEATRAAKTHISGGFGLKTFDANGDTIQNIVRRDGTLSTRLVPRFTESGVQLNPDKKDRKANEKRLVNTENSIFTIAEIKDLIFVNPQVFTVLGRLQELGTNILDVAGFNQAAKALGGDQVRKAIQKARQFIKTAKDDIFDDPRISDRDLKIIEEYIGIIMDDSAFGVGATNALASIIGLERAAVTQMALSMYSNTPALQKDLIYTTVDEKGVEQLDVNKDSIAQRVLRVMMKSYGFTATSIAKAAKDRNSTDPKVAARGNYVMQQMDNLMLLAKNSVRSLQARKTYASEEEFKAQYSNQYINTLGKTN